MNKNKHYFMLPIGDWSDDGHGECDYFLIESSHTIKEVMEAYIEMDADWEVSEICSDYQEYTVNKDTRKTFKSRGIVIDKLPSSQDLAKFVCDCVIKHTDKGITLVIIALPEFNNWTASKQTGEEIKLPGYGVF